MNFKQFNKIAHRHTRMRYFGPFLRITFDHEINPDGNGDDFGFFSALALFEGSLTPRCLRARIYPAFTEFERKQRNEMNTV
jgi:hypothetical protein